MLYLSSDANSLLWLLKMERIVRGNHQRIPSIRAEEEPFDVMSFHSHFAPPPKITIFWLAKEISPTCSGDHLNHCTNLPRKSLSTTIFKKHGPWMGGTSYKLFAWWLYIFLRPSNKRAKIPRPIAFVSWVLKWSYMFTERTMVFSKTASTPTICGEDWGEVICCKFVRCSLWYAIFFISRKV